MIDEWILYSHVCVVLCYHAILLSLYLTFIWMRNRVLCELRNSRISRISNAGIPGIPAFHAFQMREFPEFPHFPHYAFPDPRTWTGCWGWHRTSLAWRGVTGHHGKGSGIVMSACPRCDVCIIICTRTYIYICILGNTRITNAGIPGIPALQMREFREYPHSVSHL
jgi:hypothetical protein